MLVIVASCVHAAASPLICFRGPVEGWLQNYPDVPYVQDMTSKAVCGTLVFFRSDSGTCTKEGAFSPPTGNFLPFCRGSPVPLPLVATPPLVVFQQVRFLHQIGNCSCYVLCARKQE